MPAHRGTCTACCAWRLRLGSVLQCCAWCEFLQCTVLGKHGAVSDDVTLRGRDVIFFLKQAKIILRCRYAPGMPRPGVSK